MSDRSAMFRKVVDACGLSEIFGEPVVERACTRAGIEPSKVTGTNVAKLLPALEESLAVYLPPDGVEAAMERLRMLVPKRSGSFALTLDDDEEPEDERTLPERVAAAMAQIGKPKD